MDRSMKFLSCAAMAGMLYGVALSAQVAVISGDQAMGTVHVFSTEAAEAGTKVALSVSGDMERIVKNAPFSAQATTTTTQVLGDGNRIQQTSEMTLARDSEGRTRRE